MRTPTPPSADEVGWMRTPLISLSSVVRLAGCIWVFSTISSPARTSTRSGSSSMWCSERVVVTTTASSASGSSWSVTLTEVSAAGRNWRNSESGR